MLQIVFITLICFSIICRGFVYVDDVLPKEMFQLLYERIALLPSNLEGKKTFFIPFDRSKNGPSKSVLENIILSCIAPQVLNAFGEYESDFSGVEWWVQKRSTENPINYHLDTAITYCRDELGWSGDDLLNCHYYPAIGTVTYLDNHPAPTVVFNQSGCYRGQLCPHVPTEVLLQLVTLIFKVCTTNNYAQ